MAIGPFKIKGNARVEGDIQLPNEAASRALTVDGSGNVASSSVTTTELGHLSGVTSAVQTQLDAKINLTEKGAANGVASLDGTGKIPAAQLPSSAMEYKGAWNASTNSPTLADGTGDSGDIYRVSVAGTQNLGSGNITFAVGDLVLYNGTIWQRSPASDAPVLSVNGQTGVVVLDTDDVLEGTTNLYHTDERAQDAVGTILVDSASVDLTYNDATPSITASVIPGGVDHDQLLNFVANEHVDHSTVQIATAADSGLTGGGDITTTRNLVVDINGTTAKTTPAGTDSLLIQEAGGNRRSITRANFLSGVPVASAGDIAETSFSMANDQATPANVTGLAFANTTVRSFEALVSVEIDATADLFEVFTLRGIQKGASWDMSVTSNGDDSGVVFSITSAGQIQYTSANAAGFVSGLIKYRAQTTSI